MFWEKSKNTWAPQFGVDKMNDRKKQGLQSAMSYGKGHKLENHYSPNPTIIELWNTTKSPILFFWKLEKLLYWYLSDSKNFLSQEVVRANISLKRERKG